MTSSLLRALSGVILVGASTLTVPAWADDAFEAALKRAVAAKERALELNDPASWEEALRRFQEADAMQPTRETRYEVGVAAQQLGQVDLAVEAYEAALELGLEGPPRDKARRFVADHAGSLARVEVRGPAGTVVYVSGLRRGTLPMSRPLVVFAGRVRLDAQVVDGDPERHELELAVGELEVLTVGAAAIDWGSPPVGPVSPSTAPSAAVTPPLATPPTVAPPAAPAGGTSAPAPGAPAVPYRTEPREHPRRGAGIGLLAGGVFVAGGSGVVIAVAGDRIDIARSELAPLCAQLIGQDRCQEAIYPHQAEAQSKVNTIETWKNVRTGAYVGLGVGGATVLAGAIVLAASGQGARDTARDTRRGWHPAVAAAPQGAVLGLAREF